MKTYIGTRTGDGVWVQVLTDEKTYDLPRSLLTGSEALVPTEDAWEWGFAGTGPIRLSAAILHGFFQDDLSALRLQTLFLVDVVSQFPEEGFMYSGDQLEAWLKQAMFAIKWGQAEPEGRQGLGSQPS